MKAELGHRVRTRNCAQEKSPTVSPRFELSTAAFEEPNDFPFHHETNVLGGTRTPSLSVRSRVLCSIELRGQICRPSESNRDVPLFRRAHGPPLPSRRCAPHENRTRLTSVTSRRPHQMPNGARAMRENRTLTCGVTSRRADHYTSTTINLTSNTLVTGTQNFKSARVDLNH